MYDIIIHVLQAIQVTARELGIDISMVKILPANTFTTPNNFVTGGSQGSDAIALVIYQFYFSF